MSTDFSLSRYYIMDQVKKVIKEINKIRRMHKNTWYVYCDPINKIELKAYKTWIQVIQLSNSSGVYIKDSSPMELTVREFKEYLDRLLTDHFMTIGK